MTIEKDPLPVEGQCSANNKGRPTLPRSGDGKLFIISGRCGRLGNRIILFANFIALAEEQGHRVSNPTFHSYAQFFEATRDDIYCRYPRATRKSWWDIIPGVGGAVRGTRLFFRLARVFGVWNERHPVFGRSIFTLRETPAQRITALDGPEVQAKICGARIVFVNGWNFRAPGLVQRHAGKIRSYFRPVAGFEQASCQAVEPLRRQADVIVGIHIRHGDYRTWNGGKCFFPVSQYAAWMRELAEQFPGGRAAFFVCSDEPRDRREFPGLRVVLGTGSAVGDLCALAMCDYILGPVSTFSMWASFYGNKPLFSIRDGAARIERSEFRVSDLHDVP